MKKYIAPFAAVCIGFLLLGPLGVVAGLVIWAIIIKQS